VLKKIARNSALLLALTVLASPVRSLHAQRISPQPSTVTGGDPEPTLTIAALSVLLPVLVTL
jgi:hypothetical protein